MKNNTIIRSMRSAKFVDQVNNKNCVYITQSAQRGFVSVSLVSDDESILDETVTSWKAAEDYAQYLLISLRGKALLRGEHSRLATFREWKERRAK